MSVHNTLETTWVCPFCKTRQNGLIYFQFGPCGYSYELNGEIDWKRQGITYQSRPDNGNAKVRGWTECANTWRMKWLSQLGLADREGINWPPDGHQLPPLEERKRLGCPDAINVDIEIVENEIRGISFPDKFEDLVVNEY